MVSTPPAYTSPLSLSAIQFPHAQALVFFRPLGAFTVNTAVAGILSVSFPCCRASIIFLSPSSSEISAMTPNPNRLRYSAAIESFHAAKFCFTSFNATVRVWNTTSSPAAFMDCSTSMLFTAVTWSSRICRIASFSLSRS